METPDTIQRAPRGFAPVDLPRLILDVVHYRGMEWPRPAPGGRWHVGAASMKPVVVRGGGRKQFPPKTVEAEIHELTAPAVYTTDLPFVQIADQAEATPFGLQTDLIEGMATVDVCPPATVPISSVEHERTQLRWSDNSKDDCLSGGGCVAAGLPNAPRRGGGGGRPLPRYRFPGAAADDEGRGFCLLCIRADAQAMVAVYSAIVTAQTRQVGSAAIALPPLQNLVNCEGGYTSAALGVTPNQVVFSPVSIVGVHIPMTVRIDPGGGYYVDQSAAEWKPPAKQLKKNENF